MGRVLDGLKPEKVFYYFEELSNIPRGSGNEKAASEYIVNFAKERGFEVESDAIHNVIIRKPASPGCENAPIVMLQNHIDIVCEKVPECDIDMEKDGLRLAIDEERGVVYAEGTSLGADNGIGLAIALAILDDDSVVHPPLEVVCTVGEETGLTGASKLDMSGLKAKYCINSDSFRLDMVQAGCAGCLHTHTEHDISWVPATELNQSAEIVIGGLIGGHSGLDTCRQRTNAHKLMGRVLDALVVGGVEFAVTYYKSFNQDNAIPRDAVCGIALRESDKEKAAAIVEEMYQNAKTELEITDPDVKAKISWTGTCEKHVSLKDTQTMVKYIMLVPDGLFQKYYAFDDPNLAESSSNLGRIFVEENKIIYHSMVRANYASRKQETRRKLEILANEFGMRFIVESDAPVWELDYESKLLAILKQCYKEMTGEEMIVAVAHGTCECGHFRAKVGCEAVSIGPEIRGLHSPDEEVDIDSVGGLYDLNIRMLKELAKLS